MTGEATVSDRRMEMSGKERAINEGDIVQMKSGGPEMTVESVEPRDADKILVVCQWFGDSKDVSHRKGFSSAVLKHSRPIK